ncbi:MAG: diaminopimelate epimerase [bacterium]
MAKYILYYNLQEMKQLSKIPFVKISATGNDFILFDNREERFSGQEVDFFHQICQRRTSVGADGVLLIDKSERHDFRLRYFNADGRESEMCGNGARGAAYYLVQRGIADKEVTFVVNSDVYNASVQGNWVRLKMPSARELQTNVRVVEESFLEEGGFVNTGVPHFVLFTKDLENLDVYSLGKKYRHHSVFHPKGTNVNFVEILRHDQIRIRTYERGIEQETLACGTGAVAAAFIAYLEKKTNMPTEVLTRGGILKVYQEQSGKHLFLEGEVKIVYEGRLMST